MKTSNKTALVALLMFSSLGLLTSPTASAYPAQTQVMTVAFSYNTTAPAEVTYERFQATAARACKEKGPRPLSLRNYERRCQAELMDAVVAKVGRADIAQIHSGKLMIASR
jgi:UrcA family protein